MIPKGIIKKIKKKIKEANNIALFCHIDPDFDCLGSMYALYYALSNIGKDVDMFTHEQFSSSQAQLLDESLVKVGGFNPKKYDLLISVDTPTEARLGQYGQDFVKHENTIKLDHHHCQDGNFNIAKISYVDPIRSSCSEIIYELLNCLKIKVIPETATMLFAGLSSDTGGFQTTNTTLNSFKTASELIQDGADTLKANDALYRFVTIKSLKITKIFYDNIEIIDKEIAFCAISQKELNKVGATKKDCSNLSNKLICCQGANISCFMVEKELNTYDCSFRSMKGYDVSNIASFFGGGGHKEASGCCFHASSEDEAKKRVLNAIKHYLKYKEKENDNKQ